MVCKTIWMVLVMIICQTVSIAQNTWTIVIHGGAGVIQEDRMTQQRQQEYRNVMEQALSAGKKMADDGARAVDIVPEVIRIMEDSPLFNAGKGAVYTHEGRIELDASIMEGAQMKAGAVTGITDIKNPILAAKEVMLHSSHVFLSGKGASEFARKQNLQQVKNRYFFTEERYQSLKQLQKKERKRNPADNTGTVGCVVLDGYGDLCAGTSTGGMTNKRYGRIGDSPVIGAGTWADNKTCAVSCTGHGEYYIRLGFSRDIAALMEYKNLSVAEACGEEIRKLTELGGTGGVIAADKQGNVAMQFNTSGMFRGYIKSTGEKKIAIFKEK